MKNYTHKKILNVCCDEKIVLIENEFCEIGIGGYFEFSYSSDKTNIFKYSGVMYGKVTIIGLNLDNRILKELFN
ncbi:hypothetical protein ACTPC6_03770 [Clostridioides difficile]|nr:hypothetical protein [Clostridioides difficile]MDB0439601.1 hypothetical protein [Clostridioides difficile]